MTVKTRAVRQAEPGSEPDAHASSGILCRGLDHGATCSMPVYREPATEDVQWCDGFVLDSATHGPSAALDSGHDALCTAVRQCL